MAFVSATLSIEGVTNPLPPPVVINAALTFRLAFADAGGAPVAVTGARLLISRPDGVELAVPAGSMDGGGTGVWLYTAVLDQGGQWRFRAACDDAATPDLPVTVTGSALSPPLPTGPILVDETGLPLIPPDGGMLTLVRVDRTPAATSLPGLKLVGVQDAQARHITGESLQAAVQSAGEGAGTAAGAAAGAAAGTTAGTAAGTAAGTTAGTAAGTTAGAAAALPFAIDAAASATAATTKAGEASASATGAASSRDAAAISAASANALNPAIAADAGITDRALLVADSYGNSVIELSSDARTLKLLSAFLSLLSDGTSRIGRPDGAASIDLTPGGITLPGVAAGTALADGVDFALTDESGLFAFIKHFIGGGVWIEGLSVSTASGITTLSGSDGAAILQSRPGGGASLAGATVAGWNFTTDARTDIGFGFVDDGGFLGFAIRADGTALGTGLGSSSSASAFTADEIAERNARAIALSNAVSRLYPADVARPTFGINHFLLYGQSYSEGAYSHPSLTRAQKYDNLMLGSSVHPTLEYGSSFTPVGGTALNPLLATVIDSSGNLLNAAAQASLATTDGSRGETPGEGALGFLRKAWLDQYGLAADPSRRFLLSSCGAGGMSLHSLEKGSTANLYPRLTSAATAVKSAAAAAGLSYGVAALVFIGGESDERATDSGYQDGPTYKAHLRTLYDNFCADVVASIAGQSRKPAMFLTQLGADYARDVAGVALAQWEFCQENPFAFLVGPYYPMADVTAHLTSNSSRWLGHQIGKVMHRVLVKGEAWKPLSPLRATSRGRQVLIDFHVPAPPLYFDLPYLGNAATDFAAKGFAARDAGGVVSIVAAAIVGDCVVALTLARDVDAASLRITYAGEATYAGNGCLRDSDPTIADDLYEYTAGSGQAAGENIAARVGKPYPLNNWCIRFDIAAPAG